MNRKANILFNSIETGVLEETALGYQFTYYERYSLDSNNKPISKTMPLSKMPYHSKTLFPFFDGLIPEGWLLDVAIDNWKLKPNDRMGLLLSCCKDCIGAVSVVPLNEE